MAVERIQLIKRTILTANCPQSQDTKEVTENPPKERFCLQCKIWIPYEEQFYLGPEL